MIPSSRAFVVCFEHTRGFEALLAFVLAGSFPFHHIVGLYFYSVLENSEIMG
jgi:hypothetical protein